MTMWNPISWWLEMLKHGKLEPQPDEDPPEDRQGQPEDDDVAEEVEEAPQSWDLGHVGAWTGWGSFTKSSSIERDVAFCKRVGISRLDVMVNDHSAKRQSRDYGTYSKENIIAFCKRATEAGISVHLTTWWMPHEKYIRGGGAQLTDLVGETGAQSVMLDAEEPWTHASKPMPWEEAGELTAEVFGPIPFGVTGIGYASSRKLGPLVARAAYGCPQCYSTAGNSWTPSKMAPFIARMWRKRFPRPSDNPLKLVVGLAGYRQSGRPGYTKDRFMTEAFNAAMAVEPLDIVYWSLRQIRSSRTTANIIKRLSQNATARAGEASVS